MNTKHAKIQRDLTKRLTTPLQQATRGGGTSYQRGRNQSVSPGGINNNSVELEELNKTYALPTIGVTLSKIEYTTSGREKYHVIRTLVE